MSVKATASQPRKRSDNGPRITQRDLAALTWIAQQCAVRLDHLSILLARLTQPGAYAQTPKEEGRLTEKRTTGIVRRWETLGLIEKQWMIAGDPPWLWLTPEGLRLACQEIGYLRSAAPTLSSINHLYNCNHVRLLVERRLGVEWISDRQLRVGMKIEKGRRPHRPDAIVETSGKKLAIEVELSVKSGARLAQILKALAEDSNYIAIWYFTRGTRAATAVKRAVAALPQDHQNKFVVYDIDDIQLTGEQDEVIA